MKNQTGKKSLWRRGIKNENRFWVIPKKVKNPLSRFFFKL